MTIKEKDTSLEKKNISFVEQIVENDLAEGKNAGRIQTRFPPEPNGYLHIGHAKAICMDFGVAEKYNGVCNLRFDDTNPTKENNEYVENILNDITWLGFKWGKIFYASDYFDKLWEFAVWMIKNGHAYIDEQTSEQIAEQKTRQYNPEHRDGKRLLSADTVQHQYHHNIGEPQLYPRYSEIKRDQGFHITAD